jgi:hypothetical protein
MGDDDEAAAQPLNLDLATEQIVDFLRHGLSPTTA